MTYRRKAFKRPTSTGSEWLPIALPGDPAFDSDASFSSLAVTALTPSDKSITVDVMWTLPSSWRGSNITTPEGHLTFNMGWIPPHESLADAALKASLACFVRKSFYLEINWPQKPLSISTLRKRLHFYKSIAIFCESIGKYPQSLSLDDLQALIKTLGKTDLKQLNGCNELMIRWFSASPDSFSGYHPAPAERIFDVDDHTDIEVIRDISPPQVKPANKHLPDWFLTEITKTCFQVIDSLRPTLKQYLIELRRLGGSDKPTPELITKTAMDFEWPADFPFRNSHSILNFINLSQGATISIISIALGARWSEVGSAERRALTIKENGEAELRLKTFKDVKGATGALRVLPLSSTVASTIQGHLEILELVEQADFPFLWRANNVVLNAGKPLKQIDKTMSAIYAATATPLEDDSSFHHHRFRHTLARIIVLALHGGLLIVRRLYDHDHLGITLGYLKENQDLLFELEFVAQQENLLLVNSVVEGRDDLSGGGAEGLQNDIKSVLPEVITAKGYREQKSVRAEEIAEALSSRPDDEFYISNIMPGLVVCRRPRGKAGSCCRPEDPQDIAKCDSLCGWHLNTEEYRRRVSSDVMLCLDALAEDEPNSLSFLYRKSLISEYLRRAPSILDEVRLHPSFAKYQE